MAEPHLEHQTVKVRELVANYRAQFDHIIQRASYQGLVTRIKQKLADGLSQ